MKVWCVIAYMITVSGVRKLLNGEHIERKNQILYFEQISDRDNL
jgi:hypothetical protein